MSTLVSSIIQQAFREGNFIAVGEEPTAEEIAEAVPKLNAFIASLFGIEVGAQFREWYVPALANPAAPLRFPLTPTGTGETSTEAWAYPPANSRLMLALSADAAVYFPAAPSDGARMALVDVGSTAQVTLNGNGRRIDDGTTEDFTLTVEPLDLTGSKWFYRADLGTWMLLDPVLAEGDPVPLPPEFDDLLVCGLATRLAPRYGVEISSVTAQCYIDMLERLKKRYRQSERMPSTAEPRTTFVSEI
jgi:hypothetical protein